MSNQLILSDTVMWYYANELVSSGKRLSIFSAFSMVQPYKSHRGNIYLTTNAIVIEGDFDLTIPLFDIQQIYWGYDEVYKPTYVRNLGFTWKPLRIKFSAYNNETEIVYLSINMLGFLNRNGKWYQTLVEMLSR